MSVHLTKEQFAISVAGDRLPYEADRHLQSCPECLGQVEECVNALRAFRLSAREWTAQQGSSGENRTVALRQSASGFGRNFACIAAAAIALISICYVKPGFEGPQPVINAQPSHAPSSSVSDAALLSTINSQLSQTVPAPMEPLLSLVSPNGETASASPQSNTSVWYK